MAEHRNVEITRTALEAFMQGDVETLASLLDDAVVWHIPGVHRFAGEFRGKAEVMDRLRRMGEAQVRNVFEEVHDVVGNDEHVVALVRSRVETPAGTAPTRSVQVLHVRNGKLIEFWAMNDRQDEIDTLIGR